MISAMQHQLNAQSSDIAKQQIACNAIEDDVFEDFCQQLNVTNIRSVI